MKKTAFTVTSQDHKTCMHRWSQVWVYYCCQQWLHEHGHLLPATSFLCLYFGHCLETFFRRLIQSIYHSVNSHHCRGSFFTPFMFLYVWPFPTSSTDKYLFVIDFAITPVTNSAICTLLNKDIRVSIKQLCKKIAYSRICWPHIFLKL